MTRLALLLAAALAAFVLVAPLSGGAERSPRPAGTLVFLERDNTLLSIDVATGERRTRKVTGVASCAPELFTTGGHVILSAVRKGQTIALSVPVKLGERPRLLGAAHAFVESATKGRVWLAGVDCDRTRMDGVREVTVHGKVTFQSHRRVPGKWLAGAIDGGLVVQHHGTRVWDPRGGTIGERVALDAVLATHGDLLAGCSLRSRCRGLSIVDAATSHRAEATPPESQQLDPGADFSPDGSLLAAPAGAHRRWSVALVDPTDGTTELVPGSQTGASYPSPTWASTGWLFFRGRRSRMMAYRPGAPRAVELPFRWPQRAFTYVGG